MGDIQKLEESRLSAQMIYDQAQDGEERNRQGQFATPTPLAIDISSAVIDTLHPEQRNRIRFLEPSVGSGAFFSALLRTITEEPDAKLETACGVDINTQLLEIANKLWSGYGLECILGSIFDAPGLEKIANLILSNPPYSRHHHLDPELKADLKQRVLSSTGIEISGLAGLHCYIMALAHTWLEEDGVSAWLVPQEILDVGYGRALKKILFQEHSIIQIHSFGNENSLFDDASVTSIVVVLRRKSTPSTEKQSVRFTVGSMAKPTHDFQLEVDIDKCDSRWSPVFAEGKFGENGPDSGTPLSNWLSCMRGVATGKNEFFIKTRETWDALGIDERYLTPIMPAPRNFQDTIVSAELSQSQEFPMLLSVDAASIESIESAEVAKYLQQGLESGVANGYLCKKRKVWFKQELRDPPDFFLTYIGRKSEQDKRMFRFVRNDGLAVCSNNYLMLYLKNKDDKDFIWDELCSLTDLELRRCSREYGDGMRKLEPSEVLELRVKR